MKKFWWRIRVAFSVVWIFRSHRGLNFNLGWRVSEKLWRKARHKTPWDAAIDEITDWYCD